MSPNYLRVAGEIRNSDLTYWLNGFLFSIPNEKFDDGACEGRFEI